MTLAAIADAKILRACAAVAARSCAVVPDFLPPPVIMALAAAALRREAAGDFRPAGIGHGPTHAEHSDIRGDRTLWLDDQARAPPERALWEALERLRIALNEATFLGLFAFEGHYALYPPGAGYRLHRDCFRDDDTRVLSSVLYLNEAWTAADGGMLRLYLSADKPRDILPVGGTLVCFLADRFEHEVLPARRDRLAIAGWFRRRSR
jgi:SM-20-related protein